jgi:PIN domain nuclease of toxin-antitoxin system
MKYLLDTHVLVWALTDKSKLSEKVTSILVNENSLFVSSVSLWEISLKFSLGKIKMQSNAPEDIFMEAEKIGFKFIPFTNREAISFHRLAILHKDPFDRMIIWQSISNGMTLLSKDGRMADYEKYGLHLIW